MNKLKEKIIDRLKEKSSTYEDLRAWTLEMPDYVKDSRLETSLQQAIYEGQVLYKADYKYHLA